MEEPIKRELKDLIIRVPHELHAQVKSRAALRGMSMTSYVERVLNEQMIRENKYFDLTK